MADGSNLPPSSHMQRLTAQGSTLGPFRHAAFRSIWTANLLSQFGSLIQNAAAAWLMTDLTRSHQLIAAVGASTTFPVLIMGVFAGALADNFDRRKVMLAAQWVMLVPSALLALLTWYGLVTPWVLIACTYAVGLGFAVNGPSWHASVRAQVGTRDMPQAIALNSLAFNVARSVGPAIGGLLIAFAGVAAAFGINAASYVMLIVVLLRWRPAIAPPVRRPILPSIREGISFCRNTDPVRRVLRRGFCIGVGAGALQPLLPVVVREIFHEDEFFYGLTLSLFGIGSIAAALFVGRFRRRFGAETTVTTGTACFALTMPIIPLLGQPVMLLPLVFVAGIGWVFFMTTVNVAIQLRAPEPVLGRALAMYQAITLGGMAIGAWLWGLVADLTSLPTTLVAAACYLLAVTGVLRLFGPMPRADEGRVELG